MVAVSSRFWGPKITGRMVGIPTSREMEQISLAVVFELGTWRKMKRSKARPIRGDMTTTEITKASQPAMWWFSVRTVNTKAAAKAWAPKAKLKTPVA